MVAANDLREWARLHSPVSGLAWDFKTRQADVERAQDVRRRVIQNARSCGKHETAERLAQQGQAGWPGDSEFKYINDVVGGIQQEGSMQTVAGEGSLKMHINVQKVTDGAGHESAHFSIFQSWMGPPQDAVAVSPPVPGPPCVAPRCADHHTFSTRRSALESSRRPEPVWYDM